MADLTIKPTSGGNLVIQDEGGDAALTVSTSGNTTLAGAANNLGTIASATNFPAGHIIQVVQTVKQDTFSMASQSETLITGYNISGSQTIDHYSLMGFSKAYSAAKKNCT